MLELVENDVKSLIFRWFMTPNLINVHLLTHTNSILITLRGKNLISWQENMHLVSVKSW